MRKKRKKETQEVQQGAREQEWIKRPGGGAVGALEGGGGRVGAVEGSGEWESPDGGRVDWVRGFFGDEVA